MFLRGISYWIKKVVDRVSMKVAVYRQYHRARQVIKIEDIDAPNLKGNEILMKVEAAAYNYNDLWDIWSEPIKIPMQETNDYS